MSIKNIKNLKNDNIPLDDEGIPIEPEPYVVWRSKIEDAQLIDSIYPYTFAADYKRYYNEGYRPKGELIVYVTNEEYNSVHWCILMVKMVE